MSALNAMQWDPVKPGADLGKCRNCVSVGNRAYSAWRIARRPGTVH